MKKIILFLWSQRKAIWRYLVVGGSGFFIDIGILYLCKQVFVLSATVGVACSQGVVVLYNFFLNKYWAFQSLERGKSQFVKYLGLVGANYVAGIATMYLFHDVFGYNYIWVRILVVGTFVPINFFLYKYWIYKV